MAIICKDDRPGRDYRRFFDGLPQIDVERRRKALPCQHLGQFTEERRVCRTCLGHVEIKLRACAVHGRCSTDRPLDGVHFCQTCNEYLTPDYWSDPDDPSVGVVIGSYGYPALIELQILTIRKHCGPIPILISDDRSPRGRAEKIATLAVKYPGVDVEISPVRIGHAGGDMSAFYRGLYWAHRRRLTFLCKLSQRFIVDRPRWLQNGAIDLQKSGLPAAGQSCIEGPYAMPLRTEAVMMKVDAWQNPALLNYLEPRPIGAACEHIVWNAIATWLGGQILPWDLFTPARHEQALDVLWHVSTPIEAYQALAAKMGVTLDDNFSVGGIHLIGPELDGYLIG